MTHYRFRPDVDSIVSFVSCGSLIKYYKSHRTVSLIFTFQVSQLQSIFNSNRWIEWIKKLDFTMSWWSNEIIAFSVFLFFFLSILNCVTTNFLESFCDLTCWSTSQNLPRNISILVEGCGEGIDIIHNAEIFVHHANNRRSFLVTVVLVSWLDRD